MTYREAKKMAWKMAYDILTSGPTPSSESSFMAGYEPSDGIESMSDADWDRYERAWEDVLEVIGRKGES